MIVGLGFELRILFHHSCHFIYVKRYNEIEIYSGWAHKHLFHLFYEMTKRLTAMLHAYISICASFREFVTVFHHKLVVILMQMCGRAGRPPFDDTGVVIIMTRRDTVVLNLSLSISFSRASTF